MNRAVFLDRDGVLVRDVHLLARPEDIEILPGVPEALAHLHRTGFKLLVVSNQPVVARGSLDEGGVRRLQKLIEDQIQLAGGPALDGFYFCPHHPKATVPAYRVMCECRKPQPLMLQQAARDHGVNLASSFMVGDRITDVIAGAAAGCRTVQVETGMHLAPPIETEQPLDSSIKPGHVCADLSAAARWILEQS